MMNDLQLTEIRNYLLGKKLPIDILLEVQDHFVSQIHYFEREEKLSFTEAFEKTKFSWDKELKPYWKGGLNLEDVSDFMRRMRKENEKSNLLWTLKWSWIPVLVIFSGAFLLNPNYFGIFVVAFLSVIVGYAFANYLKNFQDFRLTKKYEKYVLTLHQHSIFIFFIIASPIINVFGSLLREPSFYKRTILMQGDFWEFIFIWISILVIIFGVFYSISAQKNYLRQIEKVKPFLQYLKTSN